MSEEKLVNCFDCGENYSGNCRHFGNITVIDHDTQCTNFSPSPLTRIADALERIVLLNTIHVPEHRK